MKGPKEDTKKNVATNQDDKHLKSRYIPLLVSCIYNTTTCKSAHSGSLKKSNPRTSFKVHSSYNEKYNNTVSSSSHILISKDFVPLFDDNRYLNKNNERNHNFLAYLRKDIKTSIKNNGVKHEVPKAFSYNKKLYSIPDDTLFRHSFDYKVPSVPKYIHI